MIFLFHIHIINNVIIYKFIHIIIEVVIHIIHVIIHVFICIIIHFLISKSSAQRLLTWQYLDLLRYPVMLVRSLIINNIINVVNVNVIIIVIVIFY